MSGKKLSFLEIAKLNKDKIVKKEVVVETKKKEEDNYLYNEEYEDDINIKNSDLEFEKMYDMKIIDIKCDFLDFVRKNYTYKFFHRLAKQHKRKKIPYFRDNLLR